MKASDKSNGTCDGSSGGLVAAIRGDDGVMGRFDGMIRRDNGAIRHDSGVFRQVHRAMRKGSGLVRQENGAIGQDAAVLRQIDFFHSSPPSPLVYA